MMRPIFLVGCPRSGTTLLRDLLRSHPNLTFPPESRFIPRLYRAFGDPSSDEQAWQLAGRILKTPRLALRWGITVHERDFAGCRSFSEVTRRLFEIWAAKEGKPRWGDKTPHYVRNIPLLLRLFPEAQVIHIVRDGRDVVLSWLRTRLEPGNLYVAARLWKEMVKQGRQDGALLPSGTYFELRYETLLAEPEATMRSVCEFLGEPYAAVVLFPNRITLELRRTARELSDPAFADSIVSDNAGAWRSGMSLRERTLFESVAGGLLSELGYPVEGLARPLSRGEKLLREADHQMRFLARSLWRLRRPSQRRAVLSFGWAMVRRRIGKPGRSR
ncbi:MAG: sulfotransferase family protein [Bryobacteraceae bacterium]